LIYEIKEEVLKEVKDKVISIMEGAISKDKTKGVPIIANFASGKNWGHMTSPPKKHG